MKRVWMWWAKLTKRLYKKPTFLLILVLIPLLTVGYSVLAQEESGMMTVALAREDDDPVAVAVMEDLLTGRSLILFVECETPEQAENMVMDGKADAAWVLRNDMENRIYRFVAKPASWNSFIRVVERRSIMTVLAREKLTGAIFPHCSRVLYLRNLRQSVPELKDVSDEELLSYYDEYAMNGKLFEFAALESTDNVQSVEEVDYLTTPIRGLLAVVVVLCGLATAMYYTQDRAIGTFSWVSQNKLGAVEFGCQMVSLLNVSAMMLLSLYAVGQTVSLGRELAQTLLYTITVALFCMLMRRLLANMRGLAVLLPVMVVITLVVCPVFFDMKSLRELQYLFPPTYYIHAPYSAYYFGMMGVYGLVLLGLNLLLGLIPGRK